jgi:hypothetical protein
MLWGDWVLLYARHFVDEPAKVSVYWMTVELSHGETKLGYLFFI